MEKIELFKAGSGVCVGSGVGGRGGSAGLPALDIILIWV